MLITGELPQQVCADCGVKQRIQACSRPDIVTAEINMSITEFE